VQRLFLIDESVTERTHTSSVTATNETSKALPLNTRPQFCNTWPLQPQYRGWPDGHETFNIWTRARGHTLHTHKLHYPSNIIQLKFDLMYNEYVWLYVIQILQNGMDPTGIKILHNLPCVIHCMYVCLWTMVFWFMTLCCLAVLTNISEENIASVFWIKMYCLEDGGDRFPRNGSSYP
jgi:hypothetical protein